MLVFEIKVQLQLGIKGCNYENQISHIFQWCLILLLSSARIPVLGEVLRDLLVVRPVARQVSEVQNYLDVLCFNLILFYLFVVSAQYHKISCQIIFVLAILQPIFNTWQSHCRWRKAPRAHKVHRHPEYFKDIEKAYSNIENTCERTCFINPDQIEVTADSNFFLQ